LTRAGHNATSDWMTDQTDFSALSFEEALRKLEEIVARLESGDAALDEAITLYTQGDALRAQCEKRLKDAQARIEKITLGGDGTPTGTAPFDDN
jgi:exodeoxyribonuclease VII small subunit